MNEVRIMDAAGMKRSLLKIAYEILARNKGPKNLAFLGLQTRGIFVAKRIAKFIEETEGVTILSLDLDRAGLLVPEDLEVQDTLLAVVHEIYDVVHRIPVDAHQDVSFYDTRIMCGGAFCYMAYCCVHKVISIELLYFLPISFIPQGHKFRTNR